MGSIYFMGHMVAYLRQHFITGNNKTWHNFPCKASRKVSRNRCKYQYLRIYFYAKISNSRFLKFIKIKQ